MHSLTDTLNGKHVLEFEDIKLNYEHPKTPIHAHSCLAKQEDEVVRELDGQLVSLADVTVESVDVLQLKHHVVAIGSYAGQFFLGVGVGVLECS